MDTKYQQQQIEPKLEQELEIEQGLEEELEPNLKIEQVRSLQGTSDPFDQELLREFEQENLEEVGITMLISME